MSAAYRCNRCGAFFDVKQLDGPPARRRGSFDEMVDEAKVEPTDPPVQIRCKPLADPGVDVTAIPFDLCGRCARGFREFLHNERYQD